MPPILYLLDGHALAYRTYYALTRGGSGDDRWRTTSGEPTAGVYGFASVLLRILETERPDYLIVVFDTGKTFRDDLYPEYKATREKMPEDLIPQLDRIRQLVDVFNIPRVEVEGYEADDVLGTIAKQAEQEGLGVKIVTGDRDLLQLVDDRIVVSLPGRSLSDAKDYFREDVFEYLGVRPDQVVDYKALVGDKSDNIPGVAGVGEKTATTLLSDYETLDGVYAHLDELKPGIRKKLEIGRDDAYLSQKLARIVTDLDVTLDIDAAQTDTFNPSEVEGLFQELEFRSLMTRLSALAESYGKKLAPGQRQLTLFQSSPPTLDVIRSTSEIAIQVINSLEGLNDLTTCLSEASVLAFDTETTSTDQMSADLVGISLSVEPGLAYYIPVGHTNADENQLSLALVLDTLHDPMTDPKLPKIGHNVKYDFVMLTRNGLRPYPLGFDTMIAEWLVNPNSRNLGLKNLAWVRLGLKMTEIEDLIGKGKLQRSMAEVPISIAAPYAADDAEVLLRLRPQLQEELKDKHATRLLNDLEMPLVKVLADMEMTGIGLDTVFLKQMSAELNGEMVSIEKEIYTLVGAEFNLNSPQQLSDALFNRLGLTPPDRTRRTSSGFYSTAAGVLEGMTGSHPVVDQVLKYRELSKLKSTYVDALPFQVNDITNRVHTSYNQTGSVTGRIASSDPNLQNIPIRTDIGRMVRRAFVARPEYFLLSVDYSQVELRIVAHMANDEAMKAAFKSGQDIHATTAAAIYNIPIEEVTSTQRRHAKAINFGLIYGMSAYGLTRTTDLTLAEAEDFVATYFERFPGVKKYLDDIRDQAAENGFVQTLLGRRRYFPELRNPSNQNIRNRAEREAINAPIQGTAADIMKLAMLAVHSRLERTGSSAKILLQVHDELVLECPYDQLSEIALIVREEMQNAYQLSVPLKTDAKSGLNWDQMDTI